LAQVSTESTNPLPDTTLESRTSPVAYIYVSNGDITAFSAASNGKLTRIHGSPFSGSVGYLAGNGKYLFGSTLSTTDIESYAIESNGALHYVASKNVVSADSGCGNAEQINLDHTGSTLYDYAIFGSECSNNTYETFKIDNSTGKLDFLGDAGSTEFIEGPLSFIADDKFGYTTDCYHWEGGITPFKRNSNGTLTQLNFNIPFPSASNGGYCGYAQATDPSGHVAIAMQAFNGPGTSTTGTQLGTYTAASNGNLSTTSTQANMPGINVGNLTAMNMAPSGKLLAIGGSSGLEVFHFNGASPITHYAILLTTDEVDDIFWDNNNHLYAIGNAANKLWVFTVTPTSHAQAPGSPYTVKSPIGLKVLPL
jgi:6-phosphogluconolactonase (cycloisomerase 2 family)